MLREIKEKTVTALSRISMTMDLNIYSKERSDKLRYPLFKEKSLMINENTGQDIVYQYNKVHNLKLAASTINHLLIRPNETFSFWYLVHKADRKEKYKEALVLKQGKIVPGYGGGLCQLADLLFYAMLHSPLSIVERHGHKVIDFPSTDLNFPLGVDATVYEPYLDLKFKNTTSSSFVLDISFDDSYMYIELTSDTEFKEKFIIENRNIQYLKEEDRTVQIVDVYRNEEYLYTNCCQINYEIEGV